MANEWLLAEAWIKQICAAMKWDPGQITRIIIDLKPREMARLCVTFVGQKTLLDIELPDPSAFRIVTTLEKSDGNETQSEVNPGTS